MENKIDNVADVYSLLWDYFKDILQNSQKLNPVYPFGFMDYIHYKGREDGWILSRPSISYQELSQMETKTFPTLPWVLLYTCCVIPLSMSIIVLLKRKNEVNIRDMNMCDLRGYLVLYAE